MDTCTAVAILNKCMDYKERWGFWPDPMSKSDNIKIIEAFKLVNYYKPGDFSFIKNYEKRVALEHDYKVICRLNAWNVLKNHDQLDEFIDDTCGGIWDLVYFYMYFYHTKETAKLSLQDLKYISKNGWTKYVLNNL